MRTYRFAFIFILSALLVMLPATKASASLFNEEGNEAYDILKNDIQSDTLDAFNEIMGESKDAGGGWMYFSYLYDIYDSVFVILLCVCWIVGPLLIALSKKNKALRKWVWTYMIFVFPAILIVIEYGVPYLYLGLA